MGGHKLARQLNWKEETHTLIELSQFLLKLNNLIFPIQICIIPMLRDHLPMVIFRALAT